MIRYVKICLCITLLLPGLTLEAQEQITGLMINERVAQNFKKWQKESKSQKMAQQKSQVLLQLPFFDDFKGPAGYPNPNKWVGKSVFINNSFGYLPPNQGVATFDALDSTGNVYPGASATPSRADVLTSQPIRLDSIFSPVKRKMTPADSVYLSFYYQPQGVGNAPEVNDSLVLVFKYPTGDSVYQPSDSSWQRKYVWKPAWKASGMNLQAFHQQYGKYFVQVMIPIRDTAYFYKGFQFRFYNYVSIANNIIPSWRTNSDEWNIDFVYLNKGRTKGDTTYKKLTFSGTNPTFLKNYTSMPYRQYLADPTNSTKPSFHVFIANLDKISHTSAYSYKVKQVNGNFSYTYNGGTSTLQPFSNSGFQNCNNPAGAAQACPPVNSLFSLNYNRDTASYLIKQYVSDPVDTTISGDSMVYKQLFYNYFSYDDGTPELGYSVEPAGAKIAYQFKMNTPDTLTAVQIYFNKAQANTSLQYFNLMAWRDNNGRPGKLIYKQNNVPVQWNHELFGFSTYTLNSPLLISGVFYVGLQQQQQPLNIGFDADDDAQSKIFYFTDNNWYQTSFKGALMIRPIIGKNILLGIESHPIMHNNILAAYPNPTRNGLSFSGLDIKPGTNVLVEVYNIFGAMVSRQILTQNHLNTQNLSEGLYIARIRVQNKIFSTKFIIRK